MVPSKRQLVHRPTFGHVSQSRDKRKAVYALFYKRRLAGSRRQTGRKSVRCDTAAPEGSSALLVGARRPAGQPVRNAGYPA
jgi:hypothetical protein